MPSPVLVGAVDLEDWARRRDAQGTLPELIRRLVRETVRRISQISFRSEEGIQLPGWDGLVECENGNEYVPSGVSAWELTAEKQTSRKANADYDKRSTSQHGVDPAKSTFVFATLRAWKGKNEWAAVRKADCIFRDVRAYDAHDLAAWLSAAPATHVWLSVRLGKRPPNASDLEAFWADWRESTRPALTSEFVLAGRSETVDRISSWLAEPSTPLSLQTDSRDESIAIFAAALEKLPSEERSHHLSRALVLRDISALDFISSATLPLILVPLFVDSTVMVRAVRAGHAVFVPLGRSDSFSARTIAVPKLASEEAAKELAGLGIPESECRSLATLARRSLTSCRRRLALSPELQSPKWARPDEGPTLAPAILAGSWRDSAVGDRTAIAALSHKPYSEIEQIFVRWSNEDDPPLRRVGDHWFLVSRVDAWSLLARYLTVGDLEQFENVVLGSLGEPDPAFELSKSERWMAGVLGKSQTTSGRLRDSLAETVAMMGASESNESAGIGPPFRSWAARIVQQLFDRANADWRVWASLSPVLPSLAEAAPDVFLSAVEEGTAGQQPVVAHLFAEEAEGFLGSSPHTGLLWALETLTWSREHFALASTTLAKLARLDPGGRLLNRPQNSLRNIFLPWHPQTPATLEERFEVIDAIRKSEPEVAWKLLRQMLPSRLDVAHPTATPRARAREWAPNPSPRVSLVEYAKAIRETTARILADVGESGPRWSELIETLDHLPAEQHDAIIECLATVPTARFQPGDRSTVWNSLRKLISQHRAFPDADWALSEERLSQLETVQLRFEPELLSRYAWLFTAWPRLPRHHEENWRAEAEAIRGTRHHAVSEVYAHGGYKKLLELGELVEQPGELGKALAESGLLKAEENNLLNENLGGSPWRASLARGYIVGRQVTEGQAWADAKLKNLSANWSASQKAEFLVCLPFEERTWDLAEALPSPTDAEYWRKIPPYSLRGPDDLQRAARKLIEHGRAFTAIAVIETYSHQAKVPASLVAEALESALGGSLETDDPSAMLGYRVSRLLDSLDESGDVDATRIAQLEWGFLPVLDGPPKRLQRGLAEDPAFFAKVVALVYRAEGEEPSDLSPEEHGRWRHAYELLSKWRTLPGRLADGTVDGAVLKSWVLEARKALTSSGRSDVGDARIGEILSSSPPGTDGGWPCEAVRDVIDETWSAELEAGFLSGVYDSRGVVTKNMSEGGAQERNLVERFSRSATLIGNRWPKTAAALRKIADRYRREAAGQDVQAEIRGDWERD